MQNNDPLLPRTCESTAEFLMGDLQVPTHSSRCRRQRRLTDGEVRMASDLYGRSIFYGKVRIVQESYLPFNMQPKLVAMAPNGLIYVPADGGLYSSDYSGSSIRFQHVFMHEMCHVWQYQSGMSVFIRGLVSGLISYAYDIDFSMQSKRTLADYRMEQQAGILSDCWLLKTIGFAHPWSDVARLANYSGQDVRALIQAYETVLGKFIVARQNCKNSLQLCRGI